MLKTKKPGMEARQETVQRKVNHKYFANQYITVKNAFAKSPGTMLMIAHRTGIERANICRYVATMKRRGEIDLIGFGLCHISGFKAGFYTISKRG